MTNKNEEETEEKRYEPSGRKKIEDILFVIDLNSDRFHHQYFVRAGGKELVFRKVDFSHSIFENCYFNKVIFDSCNFIGCKFINCNFHSCQFPGVKFDYATFEKTYIDNNILEENVPLRNNLILKFARTLRVNYQGIGEAESVNKAIKIELKATKKHLFDAWNSKDRYYRDKYKSWARFWMFINWFYFKAQDFIWGNGESAKKLILTGVYLWILFSFYDTLKYKDPNLISNYWKSILDYPAIFMGINKPANYSSLFLTFVTIIRFIGFALFTSILIKRFNKR